MGAWLTKHVKVQMVLRGISEAEVHAALADPGKMERKSKSDRTAKLVTGKAGDRFLTVVIDEITQNVITAYTANRKERRVYESNRQV